MLNRLPNLTSSFALVLVLLLPVGAQALTFDNFEVGGVSLLEPVPGVGEELSDESGLSTSWKSWKVSLPSQRYLNSYRSSR
jgi:hypothetical protein